MKNKAMQKNFSETVDEYVSNHESKFQLQYVDYEKNQWTAACLLTEERANRFKNDASVKKVKIMWRSCAFEISPN